MALFIATINFDIPSGNGATRRMREPQVAGENLVEAFFLKHLQSFV